MTIHPSGDRAHPSASSPSHSANATHSTNAPQSFPGTPHSARGHHAHAPSLDNATAGTAHSAGTAHRGHSAEAAHSSHGSHSSTGASTVAHHGPATTDDRRHPRNRRRRRRRVLGRLVLRRYGWIKIIVGLSGGVVAFAGGLWLTALLLGQTTASLSVTAGSDLAPQVYKACQDTMLRVNCQCFWEQSRTAYTAETIGPILQALAEREQWGLAITRARLSRVAGENATRVIGRALYDCVEM